MCDSDDVLGLVQQWDSLQATFQTVDREMKEVHKTLDSLRAAKELESQAQRKASRFENAAEEAMAKKGELRSLQSQARASVDRAEDAVRTSSNVLKQRKMEAEEAAREVERLKIALETHGEELGALSAAVDKMASEKAKDDEERIQLLKVYDQTVTEEIDRTASPLMVSLLFLLTETFFIPMLRWLVQVFDCHHDIVTPCDLYLDVYPEMQCFSAWQHALIAPLAAFAIIALYPAAAVARSFLQLMDKNKTIYIQQRYTFIHTNMLVLLMATEVMTGHLPWPKLFVCFTLSCSMLVITLMCKRRHRAFRIMIPLLFCHCM